MYEIFYSIKTKNVSSRKICQSINKTPSNQNKIECYDYEGGGIWIKTLSNPISIQHKLERQLDIKLGDPLYRINED